LPDLPRPFDTKIESRQEVTSANFVNSFSVAANGHFQDI
jgi:hypothetical protein